MQRNGHGTGRRSLGVAFAALFALLVVACGGPGQPSPGDIQQAEDALDAEETRLDDAVAQAIADLEAAVAAIDPCLADPQQLASVYEPLVVLQQTGNSDAFEGDVVVALQPVVRAMARAHTRGDLKGFTGREIVERALDVGIDASEHATEWMRDEQCRRRWRLALEWEPAFTAGVLTMTAQYQGHVDFAVAEDLAFEASGDLTYDASGSLGGLSCTIDADVVMSPMQVSGRHRIMDNTLALEVRFGEGTGTISAECAQGLSFTQPFLPSQLLLPAEIPARDGEVRVIDWSTPGGTGELTLTLALLD